MREEPLEAICTADYHLARRSKRALAYRLARRSAEVRRAVERYAQKPIRRVLDVGTADGLMLQNLRTLWPEAHCVGVDLSRELLLLAPRAGASYVQANALYLPFLAGAFDLVVSTATIEHVTDPCQMVAECYRVLAPAGLCLVTTPDPFHERIAAWVGHLPPEAHHRTWGLRELCRLFVEAGFTIREASKFMLSPWGLPGELGIERLLRAGGLKFLLANQILVAHKPHPQKGC